MDNERFTPFVLIIERITKNIKRIADMEMEPYGLRSSHVMCILQLAKSENGLSSSALAEACGVDKAFISRITSELLEKNYIVKEIVPGKTYKTSFLLTEAWVLSKCSSMFHAVQNSAISRFTPYSFATCSASDAIVER